MNDPIFVRSLAVNRVRVQDSITNNCCQPLIGRSIRSQTSRWLLGPMEHEIIAQTNRFDRLGQLHPLHRPLRQLAQIGTAEHARRGNDCRRWSRYGAGVHCYILSCCRVRQGCRSGLTQYLHVVVTKGIERRYAPGSQIPLKMLQLFHHPWLRCRRRAACRGLSAAWHRDRVRQQRRIRTIVRHWPSPEQENRTTARAFPAAKYE